MMFSLKFQEQDGSSIGHPSVFMTVAGLVHLLIIPIHGTHALAHALFFAVAGVAQIAWSVAFWRRSSMGLARVGILLASALIVLWAITRIFPAPFYHGPEPVDVYGVIAKLAEGLAAAALGILVVQMARAGRVRLPAWRRSVALWLLAGLAAGGLTYGIGRAAEPLFPWLGEPEEASRHHHDVADEALPIWWDAPEFQLTNQYGETVSSSDLYGKVIVTNFIFTGCKEACPVVLVPKMQALQSELQEEELLVDQVVLLSFSVDPRRDTPAVLHEYAGRVGAIAGGWHFLTGPEEEVHTLLTEGFKVGVTIIEGEDDDDYDVMHSNRFMLIDRAGQIRHHEDGWELDVGQWIGRIRRLTQE